MKKSELIKIIREILEEEKPGLWANIRAKRKRVGKKGMAKKGSKAYKSAKKAGDRINKEKNEELKADDDTEFTVTLQHLLDKHVTKGGEVDEIDASIKETLMLEVIDENITEAKYKGKTVTLNKPMRGDSKKFKVYVNSGKKNADGSIKVKKVNFGAKGMNIKKNNPKRRKAFRARHRCDNPGPKTMARYWSCKKW